MTLPPLPNVFYDYFGLDLFTADQMRDYATAAVQEAVAKEREACAKVCESQQVHGVHDDYRSRAADNACIKCADAIRARKENP